MQYSESAINVNIFMRGGLAYLHTAFHLFSSLCALLVFIMSSLKMLDYGGFCWIQYLSAVVQQTIFHSGHFDLSWYVPCRLIGKTTGIINGTDPSRSLVICLSYNDKSECRPWKRQFQSVKTFTVVPTFGNYLFSGNELLTPAFQKTTQTFAMSQVHSAH